METIRIKIETQILYAIFLLKLKHLLINLRQKISKLYSIKPMGKMIITKTTDGSQTSHRRLQTNHRQLPRSHRLQTRQRRLQTSHIWWQTSHRLVAVNYRQATDNCRRVVYCSAISVNFRDLQAIASIPTNIFLFKVNKRNTRKQEKSMKYVQS